MIKGVKMNFEGDTTRLEEAIDNVSPQKELEHVEAMRVEKESPIPRDEYLTIKQIGALLHISRSTIWRYSKLGILKPLRLGSRIRFARSDVDNYLMTEEGHGEH